MMFTGGNCPALEWGSENKLDSKCDQKQIKGTLTSFTAFKHMNH